jgi:3-oxoacyl-ACP reductase-like protein
LSSVSSLTNQIIATVETGFNIPDPEELAKEDVSLEQKGLKSALKSYS